MGKWQKQKRSELRGDLGCWTGAAAPVLHPPLVLVTKHMVCELAWKIRELLLCYPVLRI
jgi:hypothetical protein